MRVLLVCLALCACAEKSPPEKVRPGATIDAEMHFARGTALASQGRHTEAIDAYQQAAALAPGSAKIHYNLGNAYARQLNYPRAIAAYQRVLALDSTHVSARHNLAAMYVKQLNYAQAIDEHRRVLSLDPGHLTTYYDLGYIYFLRGESTARWKRCCKPVWTATRPMPPSTRLLGRTRLKGLDFERAAAALTCAVALDSTDGAAYVDLAQVELKRREYSAAERAARRAIALDSLSKEAYFALANALKRLGRREESTQVLAQFRALDQQLDKIDDQLRMLGNAPDDHEARAQLGLLYTEQGRLAEARRSGIGWPCASHRTACATATT